MNISDELVKLESLRKSGTLTDSEFEKAKSLVLNGSDLQECNDCKQRFSPDKVKATNVTKSTVTYSPQGASPGFFQEVLNLCDECANKRNQSNYTSLMISVFLILVAVAVILIVKTMRGQ